MPERASMPDHPSVTARATTSSHGSPAATVTRTAPSRPAGSTVTPRVATRTTVPSNPSSATTTLLPPASTSSGSPAASTDRTASTSSSSVATSTSRRAGPPRRRVVRSASRASAWTTGTAGKRTAGTGPGRHPPGARRRARERFRVEGAAGLAFCRSDEALRPPARPSDVTTDAAPLTLTERVAARLDASGRYPRAVLIVAISGLFATTFPVTVLTLAIPTIAEDFGVSQASLAWLVTLPILTSALALPVLGKLGDLHGHRRMFVGGFALATVATALSATATHPALLIAWRTLAIVAGSSTMPSSLALINSVHRGPERARAMGWWAMTSAGAPVVGLTLGAP